MSKPGLLFLCVANSARSQMAEALAKARYGDAVFVQSAGSEPSRVHPLAAQAMSQRKLDASGQISKSVDAVDPATVSVVVTLCAEEYCPAYLHQALRLHWPMPTSLATLRPSVECRSATGANAPVSPTASSANREARGVRPMVSPQYKSWIEETGQERRG